ncbi:MAG: hypothetical protein LJE60_01495, partial [Thiocapsa sp.]|nr:hypothetical protein [Thiocapsa sp.]
SEAQRDCHQDGLSRPKVFNFLGFTHFVTRSRSGRFLVGRQTEGKRFRTKLKALNERLRALRVAGAIKWWSSPDSMWKATSSITG